MSLDSLIPVSEEVFSSLSFLPRQVIGKNIKIHTVTFSLLGNFRDRKVLGGDISLRTCHIRPSHQ